MKTVCKKLFSLMLVALMLVSVMPFAASADTFTVTAVIKHGLGEDKNVSADVSARVGTDGYLALNDDLIRAVPGADMTNYAYETPSWYVSAGTVENGKVKVESNLTVAIRLYEICACEEELITSAGFTCTNQGPELYDVNIAFVNRSTDVGISNTSVNDVVAGGTVDLSSLVPAGYTFASWVSAGGGSISSNATLTVNGNMSVTVYVNAVPGGNSGTGTGTGSSGSNSNSNTNVGGEPQPGQTVGKVDLTIKYNIDGYVDRTVKATKYDLYKQYVGEMARGGYDFQGWYSEYYDDIIDITEHKIKADDTISAQWSPAKTFTLILDENRGATETVNTGKQVVFGQPIGALPTPERDGYVFMGWKLNGTIITKDTIWDLPGDGTAYAQWKLESDVEGEPMGGTTATADGKVYLEIYVNGDTDTLEKRVDITDYAKDNKITQTEAETVVKKYVTAKSGYTLKYEGLFDEETWWWYVRDPETDGATSVVVNRDGDDYVYVMVKNVKTVAADPSNPKTGDGIFAVMSVMMGSGAAALSLIDLRKKNKI